MSASGLQRVYVRMLFDPAFVDAVHRDPAEALSGTDVTEVERGWLLACDRRLFTADPLRRRRSLKGLVDEFKGSSALVVARTRKLATLDAFFSSPLFHGVIQQRGSMALAYADYLGTLATLDPRIAAVATLEGAMARARRGRAPTPKRVDAFDEKEHYALSPHVALARVPGGTLAVLQGVEQLLFELSLTPVAALAEDGPNTSALPEIDGSQMERYLATRGEGDQVGLEELPEELTLLLEMAAVSIRGAALRARAEALGADRGLLEGLVRDRLLERR